MAGMAAFIRNQYSTIFRSSNYHQLESQRCMATISRNEDVCFGRNRDSRVEAQVVEEYEGNAESI